jgi:O-methyltransferase
MAEARELYLELLARCLLDALHGESASGSRGGLGERWRPVLKTLRAWVQVHVLRQADVEVAGALSNFDPRQRWPGPTWPRRAHTMIGEKGLENLRHCVESVLGDGVPGDMIETGVWRGGASIFMRGVLAAHGVTDRVVYVADSFRGLPEPDAAAHPLDRRSIAHVFADLRVSRAEVEESFRRYGLLDEQVRFLEGWFADTLPHAPIERLAVMRLDGDMYGSTMVALRSLYPRLAVGGYVIVDDYGALPECRQAVEDYRREAGIVDVPVPFDWAGAFWRRSQ